MMMGRCQIKERAIKDDSVRNTYIATNTNKII
jgi:hypothetical protein